MFPLLLPFRVLPAAFVVVSVLASPFHPGPHGEDNSTNSTSYDSLSPAPAVRSPNSGSNCFPAIGFKTPSNVPRSLDGWWCDPATEYAFVGFSYEVTACESVFSITKVVPSSTWLGVQVRAQPSYEKNFRTFATRFIRDTFAFTVPAIAKASTMTSLLQLGITPWVCMPLSG